MDFKDSANDYLNSFNNFRDNKTGSKLELYQLDNLYRTNWIARKICDAYAEDMTRAGVEWLADENISALLDKEFNRLKIWSALTKAIKYARLYGGSLAVISIDGLDFDSYKKPLSSGIGFNGLIPFSRVEITANLQSLLTGARFGEPASYKIQPAIVNQSFDVHASRCIRFLGAELPPNLARLNELWGDSVIQSMYDRLEFFNDATDSTNELMKRAYLRFLGVSGFWQAMTSSDPAQANNIAMAAQMINEVQNISGLTVADKDDTFSNMSYSFGGVKDVLDQFGQQIAGATGIPLVRLFGMSPSGFSTGETDLKNYYSSIYAAQESALRDPIATIARLILENHNISDEIDFKFISLDQPSNLEKIQVGTACTTAILQALESGIINSERAIIELKKQSAFSGLFSSISAQDIEAQKGLELPTLLPPLGEQENGSV